MRLRLACALIPLITACGGEQPSYEDDEPQPCLSDDELPVDLEVVILSPSTPSEPSLLTASVEGLPVGERYTASFDSMTAARAAEIDVEVFYDGASVITYTVTPEVGCEESECRTGVSANQVDYCLMANGELRYASTTEETGSTTCVADAFCEPRCYPDLDACAPSTRCGSRLISAAPVLAALDCVPIGAGAEGDACSYGAPGPDGHDDCGAGLVCVDAICRAACVQESDCDAGACEELVGHAREIRACVPSA